MVGCFSTTLQYMVQTSLEPDIDHSVQYAAQRRALASRKCHQL
jgi:hypothetical protein